MERVKKIESKKGKLLLYSLFGYELARVFNLHSFWICNIVELNVFVVFIVIMNWQTRQNLKILRGKKIK